MYPLYPCGLILSDRGTKYDGVTHSATHSVQTRNIPQIIKLRKQNGKFKTCTQTIAHLVISCAVSPARYVLQIQIEYHQKAYKIHIYSVYKFEKVTCGDIPHFDIAGHILLHGSTCTCTMYTGS